MRPPMLAGPIERQVRDLSHSGSAADTDQGKKRARKYKNQRREVVRFIQSRPGVLLVPLYPSIFSRGRIVYLDLTGKRRFLLDWGIAEPPNNGYTTGHPLS